MCVHDVGGPELVKMVTENRSEIKIGCDDDLSGGGRTRSKCTFHVEMDSAGFKFIGAGLRNFIRRRSSCMHNVPYLKATRCSAEVSFYVLVHTCTDSSYEFNFISGLRHNDKAYRPFQTARLRAVGSSAVPC